MTPMFDNGVVQLYQGDARQVLRELPAESVHCVVTSPPYWGLRDYGLGPDALGLEPTIELYVQHIVEIFREVRRVLRSDGTLWLNMGDSYAADTKWGGASGALNSTSAAGGFPRGRKHTGLKPKDLCMVPARVALALQADGWWLRSDIVWSKPNPMPESVTDRPTRAHEYLFLLTRAERYYYDADAIREPAEWARWGEQTVIKDYRGIKPIDMNGLEDRRTAGRNKRSVWMIATEPYPEAHFATFPQKLVEPCILAGTSERGVCPECGAPWERVVERSHEPHPNRWSKSADSPGDYRMETGEYAEKGSSAGLGVSTVSTTTGWRPTCACGQEGTVPGVVLDPFAGSGTVTYVAQRLGRQAIGIDLSAEYLALAEKRLRGQTLPMAMELTS